MTTMRRGPLTATTLLAGACAALIAGCGGSGTKTVSVAETSPQTQTGSAAQSTTSATTPAASTPASPSGGAVAPSSTRTAPAPAFTNQGTGATGSSEGLSAALALVRSKGDTVSDASDYHPNQTLRVLIGTRSGSGGSYGQQAFFFVDGNYIGTDAKEPSATLKVLSQGDTEVVLAYPLYRRGDLLSHPSGGQATVRFQLNNGQLEPLGTIPPVSSESSFSRR